VANGILFGLSDAAIVSGASGQGLIKTGSAKGFAIKVNDTSAFADVSTADFVITTSGNVGIGTVSPPTTLAIKNTNTSATLADFTQALTKTGINIQVPYTADGYNPGLFWSNYNNYSTVPKMGIWMKQVGTYDISMLFGTSDNGSVGITNTALAINKSGNVGIGTTGPATALDILAANGVTDSWGQLLVRTNDAAAVDVGGMIVLGGYGSGTTKYNFGSIAGRKESAGSAGAGYLAFGTITSAANTEKVRITSTGNVGIGTTSPAVKLEVAGTSWLRGGATTTGLFVDSNGNTGIGTTNPLAKLHVEGQCVTGDTLLLRRKRRKKRKNGEDGRKSGLIRLSLVMRFSR